MRKEISGERAEAAFFALIDVLVAAVPGAWERSGSGGARLVYSGSPLNTFNGVFRPGHEPAVGDVAEFAAISQDTLWSVLCRGEPSARLRAAAAAAGLGSTYSTPLLRLPAGTVPPAPTGTGDPVVRQVTGADSELFIDALTSAFELPREVFANVMSAPMIDAPGVTAYVVEVDGEPVATSFGLLADGLVGVYNVATVPRSRRRGHGRLATQAVLRDGFEAGADGACLLATPPGVPLYRSMGFEPVEQWTYLLAE